MAQIKVLHLEMDGEHYYFGSPKAMFDIMGPERMGMSYRSFHSNIRLRIGEPYKNRRRGYIIRVGILGQAKTNRNNHLRDRLQQTDTPAPNSPTLNPDELDTTTNLTSSTTPDTQTAKRKKKDTIVPEQLTLF